MDWLACMNSEVFRAYAEQELKKMAESAQESSKDDSEALLDQFDAFERDVVSSPKKAAVFRALQNKIANDPEYAEKVSRPFRDAVMMLNLDKSLEK